MSDRRRGRAPSMMGKNLGIGSTTNHEPGGKKRSLSRIASSSSQSEGLGKPKKGKKRGDAKTDMDEDPDFPRDAQGRKKNVIWDRTFLDLSAAKTIEKAQIDLRPIPIRAPKTVAYVVQKKKKSSQQKKTVGVTIPAPKDIAACPLLPPIQKGPKLDTRGRIVTHSILGQAEDYVIKAGQKGPIHQVASSGTKITFGTAPDIKSRRVPNDSDSRALQYWQDVLADRGRQRSNIIDLTKRNAGEVLMGEGRSLSQYKIFEGETTAVGVLAHQYSVTNRTGTRGRGFWKQPTLLGTDLSGVYESITLSDKGHTKQIEYIGVPVPIRIEKGYISMKGIPDIDYDYIDKPNIRELCAAGNYPVSDKVVRNDIKQDQEDSTKDMLTESPPKEVPSFPRLILGGHELTWCDDVREGVVVKTEVGMNGSVGERIDGSLEMINSGTTAIFYDWKRIPETDVFDLKKDTTRKFFFDESYGVILPGQTKYIRAIFKSPTPGVYSEMWKFETRPPLCGGGEVQVTVWGIARAVDEYRDTRQELERRLQERVENSIVTSFLDQVILSLNLSAIPSYCRRASYRWIFENAPRADDHFNTINKGFYYHSDVIKTLLSISPEQDGDDSDSSSEDMGHVTILSLETLKKNLENLPGSCADRDKFLWMFHRSTTKLSYPVVRPVAEESFSICRVLLSLTIDGMVMTSLRLRTKLGITSESNLPEGIMGRIKTLSKDVKGRRKTQANMSAEVAAVPSGKNSAGSSRRKSQVVKAETTAEAAILRMKEAALISKHNPLLYSIYKEKLYLETYKLLGNMVDKIASSLGALKTPSTELVIL